MSTVRLSSKGQMVLPRDIRKAIGASTGAVFRISRRGKKIVLEPLATSIIDRLYGKFAGEDMLSDLEAEHKKEARDENRS
ncbi:MAG: AbrB/MazE/SpoVT family DNA-binding domain-containing protein [Deltaproteobacteria bacterium]|nr:AbrB/MazE/SpoVT family DNA-binding domain-containing protein [Deltaproteobacteria bacterium]